MSRKKEVGSKPKSAEYIKGFKRAEKDFFLEHKVDDRFSNPFTEGSEAHQGYQDAMYIFLQK